MSVTNIRWRENQVTHFMCIIKKEWVYYHWNICKSHFFFTFLMNFQCKWMLWSVYSRTIIHVQAWTACGHCENCLVFLNFDIIVPLIKSLYLIQRRLNNIKIRNFCKIAKISCNKVDFTKNNFFWIFWLTASLIDN